MKKIGVIGAGQMGGALIKGLIEADFVNAEELYVSGGHGETAKNLQKELGFTLCQSNAELAEQVDCLLLAVTPKVMPMVLEEVKSVLSEETLLISLAASMLVEEYLTILGAKAKIVRAIPNTPVAVLAGMTAISYGPALSDAEKALVEAIFQAVGEVVEVDETQLDSASTISGCSPAFVALFIEALADGGVLNGLSRKQAYLLAEQAVLGTAKLALVSGQQPGTIKDDVCSPGGSTIKGVVALEQHGFRNAVIQAVDAATKN